MSMYPGTETLIEVGDHVAWTRGHRDTHDYGTVSDVAHDIVTIAWRASESTVDHPVESLRGLEVYTSLDAAQAAFLGAT